MHKKSYEEPESELVLIDLEGNFMFSNLQTGESFNNQTGSDDDEDWE